MAQDNDLKHNLDSVRSRIEAAKKNRPDVSTFILLNSNN